MSVAVTSEEPAERSLGHRVGHGLRWSFVNTAVGRTLSFGSGIVLARLLTPDDFGAYAAAIAVVNILLGLNDVGMLVAVVRATGDLRVAARTAMTIATGTSVGLYLAVYLSAPAFATTMNSPESAAILRVLALAILVDGLTTVSQGLLVREFRQDRMAIGAFVAAPVNFGTSIVCAALGAGPWSLAIGHLAGNCVSGILFTAFAPLRVGFGFRLNVARSLLAFGAPLAVSALIEFVLLNADYVIVGHALGPVSLGLYMLAYNISNWPIAGLTDAVRRVSIAGFARLSHDEESLRANFGRTFALLVALAAPVCLALGLLAAPLVRFVYGDKWGASADVLRFLAVLGAVRVAVSFIFDLLVGAGRTRTTLWLQSMWLVVLVPALAIGARLGGIQGVGAAHAAVGVGAAIPLFVWAIHRFGVDLDGLGRRLARPAVGAAVAAAVAIILLPEVAGTLAPLVLVGPAIAVSYAAVVVPWSSVRPRLRQVMGSER